MDKHAHVHKMIREVFRYRGRYTCLPWGSSQRYGRSLFPILFKKCNFTKGAEVGVRFGRHSAHICAGVPNLHLLCIDPWMEYARYTKERQDRIYGECVQNLQPYNATIIRKTSMDAVKDIELSSLDFVYIDGNHTFDYVMEDIIHWSRRVKSGGIILLHDYHNGRNVDVVPAVDAYARAHHIDPYYVTKEVEPTVYWVQP